MRRTLKFTTKHIAEAAACSRTTVWADERAGILNPLSLKSIAYYVVERTKAPEKPKTLADATAMLRDVLLAIEAAQSVNKGV